MVKIGQSTKQIEGYKAFIPDKFPPADFSFFQNKEIIQLLSGADLLVGKLGGLAKLLLSERSR